MDDLIEVLVEIVVGLFSPGWLMAIVGICVVVGLAIWLT